MQDLKTDACIIGGGPAGMFLGLLLAAQGIKVTVLESHHDFEREYRGEVLMPRFTQMMRQIGLWEHLQKYQHLKLKNFELFFKDKVLTSLSFAELSKEFPFALWMPQPILLNALWDKAKTYPHFNILFGVSFRDLIKENNNIIGVVAEHEGARFNIHASVTVGADGRFSALRKTGGFEFEYEDYDFDLVWFTVKHALKDENTVKVFFSHNHNYLVLPKYPDLAQCGLLMAKGEFPAWRAKGIEAMRQTLLDSHPLMHEFAAQLKDFNAFSVLQARISYVKQWAKDGCLLIGDAAHTCSPIGAIGVSVATATAIVAADVLSKAFATGNFSQEILNEVQVKRSAEVKEIHRFQRFFTKVVFLRFAFMKSFSVLGFLFLAKTGLMRRFQKRIMVMDKPLPITDIALK